jgi:hypothetical protein
MPEALKTYCLRISFPVARSRLPISGVLRIRFKGRESKIEQRCRRAEFSVSRLLQALATNYQQAI